VQRRDALEHGVGVAALPRLRVQDRRRGNAERPREALQEKVSPPRHRRGRLRGDALLHLPIDVVHVEQEAHPVLDHDPRGEQRLLFEPSAARLVLVRLASGAAVDFAFAADGRSIQANVGVELKGVSAS
jgi:hypothetical protein